MKGKVRFLLKNSLPFSIGSSATPIQFPSFSPYVLRFWSQAENQRDNFFGERIIQWLRIQEKAIPFSSINQVREHIQVSISSQFTSLHSSVNGALEAVVPTLALELQPLRVNAVAPGGVATPFWGDFPEEMREAFFAQSAAITPAKRIGRPEDVAQIIAMLISNTFMTSTIIDCDGGARIRSSW
jgi:NAD(P)-dependent dehydrogenase (short-subunit alcohol dehydrogenase family)